jgi:hypothetical protein
MRRCLIVILVSVLGCGGPTDPYAELQVSLLVEPVVVRAGAPATVLVTVFNPTRRDVELPGCSTRFEVTTVNDGVVGPPQPICSLLMLSTIRVAAGNQYTFVYSWSGTGRGAAGAGVQLPSGEYRLYGVLYPSCGCGPRSEPATVLVD